MLGHATYSTTAFQSTHPSREAPCSSSRCFCALVFQSTPPSREATNVIIVQPGHFGISIHASLAGGDSFPSGRLQRHTAISIHASLAGGDSGTGRFFQMGDISIHASLAGGDRDFDGGRASDRHFNPRLPRGRRLSAATHATQRPGHFNPRLPRGRRRRLIGSLPT